MDGLGVKYAERVNIVWQDVDDPAAQEMALKHRVRAIPTLVLLDSSDQAVGYWLGWHPPRSSKKLLPRCWSSDGFGPSC